MRMVKWFLVGFSLLVGLILFAQNQGTQVSLQLWGDPLSGLSLSQVLLVAYLAGFLVGALFLSLWFLREYLRQRRLLRSLNRLSDRLVSLEQSISPAFAPGNAESDPLDQDPSFSKMPYPAAGFYARPHPESESSYSRQSGLRDPDLNAPDSSTIRSTIENP